MHADVQRRDRIFLAACLAVTLVSLFVIVRYFGAAFPEASIDFRYDRGTSRALALKVLGEQGLDVRGMKHAVVFESDDLSRVFLERSLGLEQATRLTSTDVLIWYWRHRWFRPLQEEEYAVEIAPTGQLVSFSRTIPESQPMPELDVASARLVAEGFLRRAGIDPASLDLVSESERQLPARTQRIFTWESRSIRAADAPYRYVITVDGGAVSSFARRLRVPDEWIRSYRELRSRNESAGRINLIFVLITMIAALAVFISRLKRGDLHLRFLLFVGAVAAILVAGVAINSFPSALARYDTTTSYPAFIAQLSVGAILQSLGSAMLLVVVCGAGEVLYRQRLPQHLAIPRLWTTRALASRRVFHSLVLGYTLTGFFIAYQVAFYLIAGRFGAWAPADIPYDDILNTAVPWMAVLFAGFFPSFSEEFLSRAFSIPFFERVLRSRVFAIVLAGFIWGFGHATYPQQPFYIRGLEVGLAGVLLGFLMYRYGLLSLLIWHYTVDAVYTSLLLFRSGNTYYVTSAAIATLVFAFPLIASIVLYVRNRGFLPDDDLSNATLPLAPAPPPPPPAAEVALPPARPLSRGRITLAVLAVLIAAVLANLRPPAPEDVIDYRIDGAEAKRIATAHLRELGQPLPQKIAAIPVAGFRFWDANSPREEGGAPGGFDDVAATYLRRNGMPAERLTEVMRDEIPAATWMVRLFTPGEVSEYFVEIDPRRNRVVGYHKYAEESAPGSRLERVAALEIALAALDRHGVAVDALEMREALSYQQPNRLDWLFHFESAPLVGEAVRRVSVRVMGSEVTELVTTIRLPEAVYREQAEQTLTTIVLLVLKIAGMVIGLGLVIAGALMATRHGGVGWRQAAKLTAALAIIPISGALFRGDATLFSYSTSVTWETFRLNVIADAVRSGGMQTLLLFLALAGLLSVYPHALALLGREGRARLGAAAAASAVLAAGAAAIHGELSRWIAHALPAYTRIDGLSIAAALAMPWPSLRETGDALFGAIVLAGAVALFATAVAPWRRRWLATTVILATLFCVMLDSNARPGELPVMVAMTLVSTAFVWLIARFVLGNNPLAWPAAAFTMSLLQSAGALLRNNRPDLVIHGSILVVTAVAVLAWLIRPQASGLGPQEENPRSSFS